MAETEDEPPAEEAPPEEYIDIANPDDTEVYTAPRKPASTPQEQMQQAVESIEKRSKYLDEPNVMSDEAIGQISFFEE